ncbi:hypothetical protein [Streptomyces sp. NRRL S-350]|uniref:hypothetical protein n=1 Tax=Streptomyces sp. NRRL S-350 TaxID=1463902 RepID=UPI0004C12A28|nr:hypothetical protein [Streptomyces sp. NRRL S-350]
MAWYQGPSRITVTAVEGRFAQRAVVTVRGAAPVELPGEVGAVHIVDAESWQLDLEHLHQGQWCANIRAVQGRWQEIRGTLTQVVHSRNRDQAGDRLDRNLVLRIERVTPVDDRSGRSSAAAPAAPAAHRTTAAPYAPAGGATAPGVRTTVSGAGTDGLRPAAPGSRATGGGAATRTATSGSALTTSATPTTSTTSTASWGR